jgi:hypothetical protein
MEDAPSFAPMDETDQPSGVLEQVEMPETIEGMESHIELDFPDIDKAEDPSDETDELLISLDELSFEQEPVTPDDSPKKEHIDQNELSISELLDFDEENSQGQTGPVVGSNLEDKPAFGDFEEESVEAFEITKHSNVSDQSENVEDYIELDLSDIDQSKDRIEDNDVSMSFEEDVSEKALMEEDEISLIPDMLNPEEIASQDDSEKPNLLSDQKATKTSDSSKDDKTEKDKKKDYIELDILEMELD